MPLLVLTTGDWYAMKASIDKLAVQGAKIMVDLTTINSQIAALTAAVAAQKTVEDSAVTLIQGMAATMSGLRDQLAGLSAGTVTQAQLDDLASQVGAQVDALNQASGPLSDAVSSNTAPAPA